MSSRTRGNRVFLWWHRVVLRHRQWQGTHHPGPRKMQRCQCESVWRYVS